MLALDNVGGRNYSDVMMNFLVAFVLVALVGGCGEIEYTPDAGAVQFDSADTVDAELDALIVKPPRIGATCYKQTDCTTGQHCVNSTNTNPGFCSMKCDSAAVCDALGGECGWVDISYEDAVVQSWLCLPAS